MFEFLTGFQFSPSHDSGIFSDKLIDSGTGRWQANGWNYFWICDGRLYRQDGNVIILQQKYKKQ